jgi:hypothetical protein
MGGARRPRWSGVRHPRAAPNEADSNLTESRQLAIGKLLIGRTKLESIVRYLGIEVDDALAISEQVES